MPKDLKRIDFMKKDKKAKECEHDWRFLERWLHSSENPEHTDYLFYCTKCLEITSLNISLKVKKK